MADLCASPVSEDRNTSTIEATTHETTLNISLWSSVRSTLLTSLWYRVCNSPFAHNANQVINMSARRSAGTSNATHDSGTVDISGKEDDSQFLLERQLLQPQDQGVTLPLVRLGAPVIVLRERTRVSRILRGRRLAMLTRSSSSSTF